MCAHFDGGFLGKGDSLFFVGFGSGGISAIKLNFYLYLSMSLDLTVRGWGICLHYRGDNIGVHLH